MEDAEFATRHVYGQPDAPVTLLEFGDFECPYCAGAAPILRDLVDGSEGQTRLVFRHFPLFEPHPHALIAALAAEAAGEQGAFWQMHDELFGHQAHLGDADLVRYGERLGLDTSAMVGEAAQRFGPAIQTDYAAGAEMGVHGTPTIFVNGDAYTGRLDLATLRTTVARALRDTDRGRVAPG
ncbi:thioredoxin-like protein [Jatrophihabitans sp. GAS493]|uniref:DsbA family protein n=1 Tax=Jatrophihabitans sp. GAS493 TaxID=1907575 RepID=UPI000BB80747|nr:DsbA family protein [Jatrophihabitans sp. GAS493]SOD71669.1 thioredoxin-like protein [Jatrophihabitans sp. GAS493]